MKIKPIHFQPILPGSFLHFFYIYFLIAFKIVCSYSSSIQISLFNRSNLFMHSCTSLSFLCFFYCLVSDILAFFNEIYSACFFNFYNVSITSSVSILATFEQQFLQPQQKVQISTKCKIIFQIQKAYFNIKLHIGYKVKCWLGTANYKQYNHNILNMRILIEDLPVIFPYSLVFNQQIQYMTQLKRTLDATGHALLEMPTGTGKTISLLALLTSYLTHRSKYKKLIYCTRTVAQMQKTLKQIKSLLKKRSQEQKSEKTFFCLGLTAKKNLCVHRDAREWRSHSNIETQCKRRTAQWVRTRANSQTQLCEYYENFKSLNEVFQKSDEHQVFTMEDLREYGRHKVQCPYYSAREGLKIADIIVFNYLYLIDPQISPNFLKELAKDTIVVFDEAHNIDDICIESYTLKVNRNVLNNAEASVKKLQKQLQDIKISTTQKFEAQAHRMIAKLKQKNEQQFKSLDPSEIKGTNLVPQSILNSQMFFSSLRLILQFLRNKLKEQIVRYYDNPEFRNQLRVNTNLEDAFFKLSSEKLVNILNLLQVADVEEIKSLNLIAFFCQLIFMHKDGFKIVHQPHPMDGNIADPLLTLSCLDCSLCMKPIWKAFPSVILTSGTLSPIQLYPKILDFQPVIAKSIQIQIGRNPIQPMILASTWDQEPLSSQYTSRSDKNVSKNYGGLLISLAKLVPDGILCFFPSYMYMEHLLKEWYDTGIIAQIMKHRSLFIEKKDTIETEDNIAKFRKACDIGRGAIFLAIARGKIAEGIDFQEHYGRCVVMMGFPVQNSLDPVLLERIKFMIGRKQIKDKNEFFEFDTMRQTSQCLGRVMRRKTDYGLMILADSRFKKVSRYEKLPKWIKKCLTDNHIDMTFESAFSECSNFFRQMGRKFQLSFNFYKTKEDFATFN